MDESEKAILLSRFLSKMWITYFNLRSTPRESVTKYRSRLDKVGYKQFCVEGLLRSVFELAIPFWPSK